MTLDITFHGLSAPLRLDGGDAVLGILSTVAQGWPHGCGPADPSCSPFFSIRAMADNQLLHCTSHMEIKPPRRLDPVNAVCDALAALALALPAEEARVICLHAAGVAIGGRLVVFPSVRRAGKSTLSVALVRAGHALYGDDVLPLSFPISGAAVGHAMGLAPRLRLPLPDSLPQGFRDWVAAVKGPSNLQYKYLPLADQPARGASLPVGAFVILDRQDEAVPARLDPLSPDAAMDVLLHQNFTRDRHSGDILRAMAATLSALPVLRLTYSDLDDAVACLEAGAADWPSPPLHDGGQAFRLADFTSPLPAADGTAALRQRQGTVACTIGETLYLADAEGRAIHRMDALATAIWEVLAEPATTDELADLLSDAFPDTARDQIAADLTRLVTRLHSAGLIATG